MRKINNNNNLPKGWRKVRLGEVARIAYGKDFPTRNLRNSGYPVYGGNGIIGYSEKYLFEEQKVIVGCRGANSGNVFLTEPKSFVTHNALILDISQELNPKFLFYKLLSSHIKQQVVTGSAQPQITINELEQLELEIPDLANQKRIADILSAFDDKIELNNKISQTLEQMAQAIFKEWFVNTEKLIRAEEIFVFEKGIEPGSRFYSEIKKEGYVPFYRVRDLEGETASVYVPKEIAGDKLCKENDVLLSLDATVGRVQIGCNGAYSSGIRKVYSKDGFIKNSFIYFWLKTPNVQSDILEYVSGTTILHAGQSIKYLKFPFNEKVINKIQQVTEPIFSKILQIKVENQKLAALRDLLLPKLMSEEIRV